MKPSIRNTKKERRRKKSQNYIPGHKQNALLAASSRTQTHTQGLRTHRHSVYLSTIANAILYVLSGYINNTNTACLNQKKKKIMGDRENVYTIYNTMQ